jgi:hypothetical protein
MKLAFIFNAKKGLSPIEDRGQQFVIIRTLA